MKILIIRLSAMGDVAMTVPVLKVLSDKYPEHEFSLVTNKAFNPLFTEISGLKIINPDLKEKHKGITGLFTLYKEIKKELNPDVIIDLHNVIRTKIIRFFFSLNGIKTSKINKDRKEKRELTRQKNKILKPLKHTTQRYVEAFNNAGIPAVLDYLPKLSPKIIKAEIQNLISSDEKKIGIAPFAKHIQKQYPIKKTEILIQNLSKEGYRIFLFGGGKKEKEIAENIEKKYQNTVSVIGKYSLEDEIALISKLDAIITPDSGNMHIAALTPVKIISIWGATHPFAGFTPFAPANRHYIVQNEHLTCRPCSVFGNKKCYKKTLECLNSIEPEEIFRICKKTIVANE